MSAERTLPLPLNSAISASTACAVAAAGLAGLTLAGPLSLPIGLLGIAACVGVGIGLRARKRQARARRVDVPSVALALGGDGIWDYDLRAGSVTYDDRCAQMLGYERGHVADRLSAWGKLVHPSDIARVRQALDDCIDGAADGYDVRVRLRDVRGCWRWIVDRGVIVERDRDGKPLRMIGIHREPDGPLLPVPDLAPADSVLAAPEAAPIAKRPDCRPLALVAATALLEGDLEGRSNQGEDDSVAVWRRYDALRQRVIRLKAWGTLQLELVPLAAAVDSFADPDIAVALDLPIAEADPIVVVEAMALLLGEAAKSAASGHGLSIQPGTMGEGRVGLSIVVPGSKGINAYSPRVKVASDLLALTGGDVIVVGNTIEIGLRSPPIGH